MSSGSVVLGSIHYEKYLKSILNILKDVLYNTIDKIVLIRMTIYIFDFIFLSGIIFWNISLQKNVSLNVRGWQLSEP